MKRLMTLLLCLCLTCTGCDLLGSHQFNPARDTVEPIDTGVPLELYYCRSLLNDSDRAIYDRLCRAIWSYEPELSFYGADFDHVADICRLVEYDHPELFWLNGDLSGTESEWGGVVTCELELNYTMEPTEVDSTRQKLRGIFLPLQQQLAGASDYEKVRFAYEYAARHITYTDPLDDQTLLSAVLTGKGVCAGYARTVQYLLQRVGIQTLYCPGESQGEGHAWNIAAIDGDYYQLDATWGDADETSLSYVYLNFTTAEGESEYTPDGDYPFPECTATAAGYYVREGRYLEDYDADLAAEMILADYASGAIAISFGSEDAMADAVADLIDGDAIFDILESDGIALDSCYYSTEPFRHVLMIGTENTE